MSPSQLIDFFQAHMAYRWTLILIVLGEVVFFIVDQWMKRYAVPVEWNRGLIARWIPEEFLTVIAVIVMMTCIAVIIRAWSRRAYPLIVSSSALFLGVMSSILDLWRVHAFVDWFSVYGLMFNAGDILIISGIIGLIIIQNKSKMFRV